jgi:hypothetical protein
MYACLPAIKRAADRANMPYSLPVGEGMGHCWPLPGFNKKRAAGTTGNLHIDKSKVAFPKTEFLGKPQ